LRSEGDRLSHEFICTAIAEAHPDDAILSEEGVDDLARLDHLRVCIVDPLDGTREYGEAGRDDWAVHVALVIDGNAVAGAVALPVRRLTLCSDPPPPPPSRSGVEPRLLVSRTRPPAIARMVAEALGATCVAMGSAGAKAMSVVLGEADVYLHAGGQYEWDSAAPVAVAAAAGLHVSRLDGSSLRYNCPDAWLPDLLICRREFASAVLETIDGVA
jgi:3'(2'), 5'-bisphosphate nucleotidase